MPVISFWGTPGISAALLEILHADPQLRVAFTVTQNDKPRSARGREVQPSAVKKTAEKLGIPVFTPVRLKKNAAQLLESFRGYSVDFHVILAYGRIIPREIFDQPRLGSVNFHASLLPELRGASPIESALWRGFTQTGWTLQKITEQLDAGDIMAQNIIPVAPEDNRSSLYEKLTDSLLVFAPATLHDYAAGKLKAVPQEENRATYCEKITTDMGRLDWKSDAASLCNQFRALYGKPGVFAYYRGKKVKLNLNPESSAGTPGEISPGRVELATENGIEVCCGDGRRLTIRELQPDGKKLMNAADFLNGYRLKSGDFFE